MNKILILLTLLASFLFAGQNGITNLSDSERDIVMTSLKQIQMAAQQTNVESKLGSAIVTKMDGTKERHSYTYTNHSYNQWATYTAEKYSHNTWINNMHTEYYYNDNGNFTGGLTKLWQNPNWVDMVRYSLTYNEDNLVASSKSEMFYDNAWSTLFQSTITYGVNFSVIEVENFFFYTSKDRITSYFDNNDNIITIINEHWEEGNWVKQDSTIIEYNSDNNPTLSVQYGFDYDNVLVEGNHILYTYDENKNRIKELTQYNGEDQSQVVLSYNSNNYLTELLEQFKNGSEWDNNTRYSYNYTNEGVSMHGVCEYWDNSEKKWKESDGEFHIFDTKGWYTDYGTHGQSYLFEGHELEAEYDGITAIRYTNNVISDFLLSENYPNPFNPSTEFSFTLPKKCSVNIAVYNVVGQQVATLLNETKNSGTYNMTWNATNFGSGVYFIQLNANGKILTQKCILLK